MSWSLPRVYFSPHRDKSSSEASVSRPLFCTATLSRTGPESLMREASSRMRLQPIGHRAIAAVARQQVARHAADGGHTHAGLLVDIAIGQAALEELDHGPAIRHGLQLGGRAQVAKKAAAFLDAAQRENRREKRALVLLFLPLGDGTVGFHESLRPVPM